LKRRRRVDQALFAVVMEAYLHGVSTRKVDDLVRALGADSGISKSEVSRICADLDSEVAAFRDRSLARQSFPDVFVGATYCKARVNRRVIAQAVVVATGCAGTAAARCSASRVGALVVVVWRRVVGGEVVVGRRVVVVALAVVAVSGSWWWWCSPARSRSRSR
jgi:hypothetical protein